MTEQIEQPEVVNTTSNTVLGDTNNTTIDTPIPDKFKVVDEATGEVDYKATLSKMSESYTGLEKRVGTGDLAPKTEDEYNVEREGFSFDEFKADDSNKAFLKSAHAHGITNKQLDFLLSEYDKRAVDLVSNTSQIISDDAVSSLQTEWGSNYESNCFNAVRAAKSAGITEEQLNDPMIGNNVALIKALAYFGSQMTEDKPVTIGTPVNEDITALMRSEAFFDPRHPEHKATKAKIDAHYNNLRRK